MKPSFLKLMLITHRGNTPLDEYLSFVRACAASGVTSVQLREKNRSFPELLEFGKKLQDILRSFSIPLIVNDDPDLALALDAEGVHLGQTDGDVRIARQRLGENKIIGVSVTSLAELQHANTLPIDYIGLAPIFPIQSKTQTAPLLGYEGVRRFSRLSKHPIIAVGGITEACAREVMKAGAQGIAAIGAFHRALDLTLTTQRLRDIIDGERL